MSSATQTNIHAALAIQLSNSRVLSEEEKLFQEALKSVQDEKKRHGTLPVVFDRINYARTIGDVQYLFQDVKKENSFWTMDIGKAWLRHLANFAECLWQYKPVLDAVATRSEDPVLSTTLADSVSRRNGGSAHLGFNSISAKRMNIIVRMSTTDVYTVFQRLASNRVGSEDYRTHP